MEAPAVPAPWQPLPVEEYIRVGVGGEHQLQWRCDRNGVTYWMADTFRTYAVYHRNHFTPISADGRDLFNVESCDGYVPEPGNAAGDAGDHSTSSRGGE